MTISPIKPNETKKKQRELELAKAKLIPEKVIQAFNELIAKNADSEGRSVVYRLEVVSRILELIPGLDRNEIFEKKWLDVEPLFEENGWNAYYVKSPYWDTSDSYFRFNPKG